jgi:hypothetical protein
MRYVMQTLLLSAMAAGFFGCSSDGPATHPVKGTVELAGGDIKLLAGSHIEAALASDPAVRASGEIQDDGSFKLQTNAAGGILDRVKEGKYQVRIILPDDDREARRRAGKAIAARFLQFKTSGLTIQVPTPGAVTIAVSPR